MSRGQKFFITLIIIIPLIGIGVGLGVFYALKSRQADAFLRNLARSEDQFIRSVNLEVEAYAYLNRVTINYHDRINITTSPQSDWVDFMEINNFDLYQANNEIKFIPVLWNEKERAEFEAIGKVVFRPDFEVSDLSSIGPPLELVRAPPNRFPLCPLSFLAPNMTVGLLPFLGIDVCNATQWSRFGQRLFDNPFATVISSRFILRTESYVLDIGLNYVYSKGVVRAVAVTSYLFSDLVEENLEGLFGVDVVNEVSVTIKEADQVLYASQEPFETRYSSVKYVDFLDQGISYEVSFLYDEGFVEAFEKENRATLLAIIVVIFFVMDVVLVLSVMFLRRKHHKAQYGLLKKKNRDMTNAFNWASHEIRGPLNSLTGYVEINRITGEVDVERGVVQFEKDDFEERTRQAQVTCLSLKHIADDVINIGMLGGTLTTNLEQWSVNDLVETVLPFFEAKAGAIGFHFACNPELLDVVVTTDRTRVIQVLHNLVGNAFKYTLEGDVWLTVTRGVGTISFEVRDTGVGIDNRLVGQLFQEDGIRIHNQSERIHPRSSGLGLHFCKLLCEKLGASIRYELAPEHHGSVFTFELPL